MIPLFYVVYFQRYDHPGEFTVIASAVPAAVGVTFNCRARNSLES